MAFANIVEKGENTDNQTSMISSMFFYLTYMYSTFQFLIAFRSILSSANAFILDNLKFSHNGKELYEGNCLRIAITTEELKNCQFRNGIHGQQYFITVNNL